MTKPAILLALAALASACASPAPPNADSTYASGESLSLLLDDPVPIRGAEDDPATVAITVNGKVRTTMLLRPHTAASTVTLRSLGQLPAGASVQVIYFSYREGLEPSTKTAYADHDFAVTQISLKHALCTITDKNDPKHPAVISLDRRIVHEPSTTIIADIYFETKVKLVGDGDPQITIQYRPGVALTILPSTEATMAIKTAKGPVKILPVTNVVDYDMTSTVPTTLAVDDKNYFLARLPDEEVYVISRGSWGQVRPYTGVVYPFKVRGALPAAGVTWVPPYSWTELGGNLEWGLDVGAAADSLTASVGDEDEIGTTALLLGTSMNWNALSLQAGVARYENDAGHERLSPYVGVTVDILKIIDSLRSNTAK